MSSHLVEIFQDERLVDKIRRRLPYLFQLAELESSRAGKIGMEVGSFREKIIVALLIHKFGIKNVETEVPITEPEIDVMLYGQPISIKTKTGTSFSGVKLIWTVDAEMARQFRENYYPRCDILFVQIIWNATGGFYYIPLRIQEELFEEMGREEYIKLPKPGTNPRGVEISSNALSRLVRNGETKVIEINWQRREVDYNPYKRWVEYWTEE
jgi:hypothetical protein